VERRTYTSTVRAESALATRAAIVSAATRLFLERGYEGASLADVARAAGVARPTVVAAFGSKPALLSRVLDEALAGDDEPIPISERIWFRPVWEATTARGVLTAYARVCVVIGARAGAVVEVVRRATDSAPEVTQLWMSWLRGRHAGAAMVVERQPVREALRSGLTTRAASDVLWTLNDPDRYVSLVEQQHWDAASYETWLAETMCLLLLDPSHGRPSTEPTA
jgi:AcrR family transcriptional regulator